MLLQKTEAEGGEAVVLWFFVWFYLKIFKCGWDCSQDDDSFFKGRYSPCYKHTFSRNKKTEKSQAEL